MPSEAARVVRYHEKWPHGLPPISPNTSGWISLHERRIRQLRRIKDLQQRWVGFGDVIQSARIMPNYTELGFKLLKLPDAMHTRMVSTLREGVRDEHGRPGVPEAGYDENVSPLLWPQPNFLSLPYTKEVLGALQPLHEEWSDVKLTPVIAYGLRVYLNGSTLLMHHDKVGIAPSSH